MGGIPLGRIAGFPVNANWSVLVILWLFTWSLASTLPTTATGYSARRLLGGRCVRRHGITRVAARPRACACDRGPTRRHRGSRRNTVDFRRRHTSERSGQDTADGIPDRRGGPRYEPAAGSGICRRRSGIANPGSRAHHHRCRVVAGWNQRTAGRFQSAAGCSVGWWSSAARVALAPLR